MNTGFVKFTYSYQSDYKQKGYKKDVNVKQNRIRHEKYSNIKDNQYKEIIEIKV